MNFESLRRNVVANACEAIVTPLPIALTDRSRLEAFNYARLFVGTASPNLGLQVDASGQPYQPRYRASVLALALDDLLVRHEISDSFNDTSLRRPARRGTSPISCTSDSRSRTIGPSMAPQR